MKNILLYLGIAGIIVMSILLSYFFIKVLKKDGIAPADISQPIYSHIEQVPRQKNTGLDLTSVPIQNSTREINRIKSFLPFTQDVVLRDGRTVSIVIPNNTFDINYWTLPISIYGIDYASNTESEKNAFLESSSIALQWLSSHNINTKNIIIEWSDRKEIRDRITSWVNKQ
jgi:hypothetical protein